jgi:phosphoribosylaminoimidazole carboxylase PurE protein
MMGSDSDYPVMQEASKFLSEFGVPFEIKILSAHRSPDLVGQYTKSARGRGIKVIIAGAGGAAHLAGVIASQTTLPVIGVPMETEHLKGIDSLFSTVQMPGGVPVSCMSIGKAGAKNAGLTVLEILGISDKAIQKKLDAFRAGMVSAIKKKNKDFRPA